MKTIAVLVFGMVVSVLSAAEQPDLAAVKLLLETETAWARTFLDHDAEDCVLLTNSRGEIGTSFDRD
jgi:hypothetical protein